MSKAREYAVKGFFIGFALTWITDALIRFCLRYWKALVVICLACYGLYQIGPEKERNAIRAEIEKDVSLVHVRLIGMSKSRVGGKIDRATFEIKNGARAAIRNIGMRCDYEDRINLDYVDPDKPKPPNVIRGKHRLNVLINPGETRRHDIAFHPTVIEGTKNGLQNCVPDFDWDDASVLRDRPDLDFRTQADIVDIVSTVTEQHACLACVVYHDLLITARIVNRSKTHYASGGRLTCVAVDGFGEHHRHAASGDANVAPGQTGTMTIKLKKLTGHLDGIRSVSCLPEAVYQ
jgi:hypothetical protein